MHRSTRPGPSGDAIDERVGHGGRSRFLEEAAQEKLDRIEMEAAIREGAGILSDHAYPHWRDAETINEWVRRSRRGELTPDDLLDTTVLIDWLRGRGGIEDRMLRLVAERHTLSTSCVNLAEVEAGLREAERPRSSAVLGRLRFLVSSREAARRAGLYQVEWRRRGTTIHTPDALVAGTARAHGPS